MPPRGCAEIGVICSTLLPLVGTSTWNPVAVTAALSPPPSEGLLLVCQAIGHGCPVEVHEGDRRWVALHRLDDVHRAAWAEKRVHRTHDGTARLTATSFAFWPSSNRLRSSRIISGVSGSALFAACR